MYYRRKVILSILQVFNNELEKIQVHKLLFLLSRFKTKKNTYDFVPYKFGSFSFQANADLNTLKKYGIVDETNKSWKKLDETNYLIQLDKEHQKIVSDFRIIYKNKSSDDLIRLTYKNFPYYSINSIVAHKYLNSKELKNLETYKSQENEIILFTIGYEGISLERYLNKLIRNNIKLLCDVRKNAASMKYGFSKKQLENACNGVGIEYIHIPEVGINPDKRKELNTQKDYDILFKEYISKDIPKTTKYQEQIFKLLQENRRIALTCFEANKCQCHRTHLANAISNLEKFNYEIEHL
ncbi:DUF488 family protein [Croceitalea marina]|uniref:DUF488 family protein n=1 Tax=Croceitalea marina TaxID=1775166 RepID=A0ABW5MZJ6_9FLAO